MGNRRLPLSERCGHPRRALAGSRFGTRSERLEAASTRARLGRDLGIWRGGIGSKSLLHLSTANSPAFPARLFERD